MFYSGVDRKVQVAQTPNFLDKTSTHLNCTKFGWLIHRKKLNLLLPYPVF